MDQECQNGSSGGTAMRIVGAEVVGVQNNSSNNWFGYFGQWYNGTNYGNSVEVQQDMVLDL